MCSYSFQLALSAIIFHQFHIFLPKQQHKFKGFLTMRPQEKNPRELFYLIYYKHPGSQKQIISRSITLNLFFKLWKNNLYSLVHEYYPTSCDQFWFFSQQTKIHHILLLGWKNQAQIGTFLLFLFQFSENILLILCYLSIFAWCEKNWKTLSIRITILTIALVAGNTCGAYKKNLACLLSSSF